MSTLLRVAPAVLAVILAGCASTPPASVQTIAVNGAPKAAGPYSQGLVVNGFLFTAGQIPRDPATGKYPEGDIKAQTNRALDNLEAILAGGGCTLQDVVKATVFMTDLKDFAAMNEAYAARFGNNKPVRTTVQAASLPGGAVIEIDLVARVPASRSQ